MKKSVVAEFSSERKLIILYKNYPRPVITFLKE